MPALPPKPTESASPRTGHTLHVQQLRVALPDGRVLIDGIDLTVQPGEVIVLLGGSGAGKSTFARVLFERDEMDQAGFQISSEILNIDRNQLGLVPQRGALFDHLDIKDNIELALRYSDAAGQAATATTTPMDAAAWLRSVGLDPALAAPGTSVTQLSGGQAQRVAVARVLASQRKLLFLDEPSVGLDPQRVRMLARLIREQVKALGISAIVVTHDVALAAGVADRLFLLSLADRKLDQLFVDEWPGALEDPGHSEAERGAWLVRLETTLVEHLDEFGDRPAPKGVASTTSVGRRLAQWFAPFTAPFMIAALALWLFPRQLIKHPRDFAVIAKRALIQTLLRPLLFYGIVSTLIGYTVLFVISKVGGDRKSVV